MKTVKKENEKIKVSNKIDKSIKETKAEKKERKIYEKQNQSYFKSVIITLIILGCSCFLFKPIFSNLNFGLDLQGGFEILYSVDSIDGAEVTKEMVTNTYKVILKRIDILGVSEPEISIEGENIRIQLAGVTNEEQAKSTLSQMANLTFRNSKDELVMTSNVLAGGGVKVVADETTPGVYYLALSISDVDTFHEKTEEIRKAGDVLVIWLDFVEGTDSFKNEQPLCGTSGASRCISYASIKDELTTDTVTLSGNFTYDEANDLKELINSGSLPTKLSELSSRTVDASFGSDALDKTFLAGIVGVSLIILFMILIYHFSGVIAGVGLIVYTALVFLTFELIGGRLTLPGIAATVIGIGMAVDSAVISFSRIKDELSRKVNLKEAYKNGNKNSFGSIIDGNITTLIAAIILFIFGESSVKGFATMLIISIIITMLIMVVVIRYLLRLFVNSGRFNDRLNVFIGYKEKKKSRFANFNFVKRRVLTLIIIPALLIIVGIGSLKINGLNLGIDFTGGTSISLSSSKNLSIDEITNDMKDLGYNINKIELINDTTVYFVLDDQFVSDDNKRVEKYFSSKYEDSTTSIGVVSNEVKKELIKNAVKALIYALVGIIIYVSIRFRFSYAVGAIAALVHDVVAMVVLFSVLKLEVTTIFIAAILSIIGYSINDTIVAFDRIRENKKKLYMDNPRTVEDLENIVNISLRETFMRSLITSMTTLLPVLALIIFGSHEIVNFNYALLFGLIAGAYSSLFVAAQLWLVIEKRKIGKPNKKRWYEDDKKEVEELKVKGINC